VLDKDVVSDDLLCTASKGLQKVLETPETWFWLDEPIKLLDAHGKRSPARLAVQAIFNAHSQQDMPFTLIKGEGLVPNESLEDMQAHVSVTVNGEPQFSSESVANDSDPFWNLRKEVPMWQGEGAENKLEFQVFDGPALVGTASLLQESVQGCHGNLQQLAVLNAEGEAKGKLLFALGDLHEEVLKALVM